MMDDKIKNKIFYFNKEGEKTMAIIVDKDLAMDKRGDFVRIYKQLERNDWTITEIKPKEENNEEKERHPQTGEQV